MAHYTSYQTLSRHFSLICHLIPHLGENEHLLWWALTKKSIIFIDDAMIMFEADALMIIKDHCQGCFELINLFTFQTSQRYLQLHFLMG